MNKTLLTFFILIAPLLPLLALDGEIVYVEGSVDLKTAQGGPGLG